MVQTVHGGKGSFGRDVMLLTVQGVKCVVRERRDVTDSARRKGIVRARRDVTM